MTRKLVYEALEKLQRGEIMKPDVMDVIDDWINKETSDLSYHNKLIIDDLRITREDLKFVKAEILELNATNSGLRYAASELEFRVDKQNEYIAMLQDQLKEADKIAAANNKKCQIIDNK